MPGRGGSFKREYDARDRAIAHSNAVSAAAALTSSLVEAGVITTKEEATSTFWSMKEEIATATLAAAGASDEDATDVALRVIEGSMPKGTVIEEPESAPSDDPGSFKLTWSKYKGLTLDEVYEKDPTFVSNFLVNKTENELVKRVAKEFMAQVG
jgi:hypothetical protein